MGRAAIRALLTGGLLYDISAYGGSMAVDTTEPKLHSSGDAAFQILIDHSKY